MLSSGAFMLFLRVSSYNIYVIKVSKVDFGHDPMEELGFQYLGGIMEHHILIGQCGTYGR